MLIITRAANGDKFMPMLRARVSADPRFVDLLVSADDPNAPGERFQSLIIPALRHVQGKTAVDVIAILSRFSAPNAQSYTELPVPEEASPLIEDLFHAFSLSMPHGVEPLPWTKEQILTCALTIYCEAKATRSRLRVV